MRLIEYNDIDRAKWSELVQSSSTGTWFQSPEAYDFFASMPDLFQPFVMAISKETPLSEAQHSINPPLQTLRAVCCGYVTVEKSAVKQFFTRRAIINGGPALADDCTNEEVETLMHAVKEHLSIVHSFTRSFFQSPIYIETRNFNDYSRWKEAFEKAGFGYKKHLNFHIDCKDEKKMWERMSETRKRQIRKAEPCRVKDEEVSEADIKAWYAILAALYRTKVKTPLSPLDFFLEAYRQGVAKYLLVKHESKVIGGIMCPILDGKCIYEWFICGMDAVYKEQYPSVMATWAAMEYAHMHAIPKFEIMGAGEPGVPYGVRDFKAEFGGKLVEYGRFLCVTKPLLYKIGTIGVKILKNR